MMKDREEHCVTALEWRSYGKRNTGQPKTTWRRMVEDKDKWLDGSHGQLLGL